ncbi:hypothetical protein MIND_00510100 [Mycena indigotica]|uniref:Cytochrome P450 n=1 Tax=Mycena indigotica TaxID=2126181 RepID=A0A8H6T0D7_9AGAR|nr:uncharacterized protein MIND_00510100 [Mycena indigotica]KAF7307165.1 hypothetical protein MIND_00510100 [Mycena indigotica]
MFPVLALALLTVLSGLWFHRRPTVVEDVHRLPGPSSSIASWIWGHELLVFRHAATQMYTIWARSFGGLFKISGALFHPDIIIATDHAAVHHVFTNSDIYVKSPAFRPPIDNLIGKGLVWSEGEDWRRQRKVLAPAFSTESVKEMTYAIYESAERLETRLNNLLLDFKGESSVNIIHYISACTLDIIGAVGLSHSFVAQSAHPGSDAALISASWTEHVNNGLQWLGFLAPLVVRAVPIVTKAPLPLMQSQGVIKTIVTRIGRQILDREQATLNAVARNQENTTVESGKKDIINMLLRNRQSANPSERLTDSQILDNISTFTMVGHETTAGSIAFTLWELARNPEYQDRLRAEILAHPRDMSYDEIQKLEYLDAVVKEGLRMHPASPQTERLALEDDIIPLSTPIPGIGDTFRVQKGQVIHVPFTTMNTNPAVWGSTGPIFDPSRWLETRDTSAPPLPHGWSGLLTFCDGPRNCVGWRLAVLEFKIIVATLIRSFVLLDTGAHVEEKISPTLQPVVDGRGGHLPLKLKHA